MAKIYYVGDWAIQYGPYYAESAFHHAVKGTEIVNYGKWLKDAIESNGAHEVTSVPSWDFYMLGPGEYEKILSSYDVLIFSDVEAQNFQLAPSFFKREQFGHGIMTFPDRIRLTKEAVGLGKGIMFLGGWQSFTGHRGMGAWGRCGLKEVLPVHCLEGEDLVESTEGFTAKIAVEKHPMICDIDFAGLPPILGYNETKPRADCQTVAFWSNSNHPLLAVGTFGQGRTLAYTSDPAPHWGLNFVFWQHYNQFWLNAVEWLLKLR